MTDARPTTTRARLVAAAALAVGLALGSAACGDDDDGDGAADTTEEQGSPAGTDGGGEGGAALEVTESEFEDVSVTAGGTLEVTNSSGIPHTITANDGAFDEELPDGETVPVTVPAEAGEYDFHCEIHPSMTATLTVQ
jgi:plastocyanin